MDELLEIDTILTRISTGWSSKAALQRTAQSSKSLIIEQRPLLIFLFSFRVAS